VLRYNVGTVDGSLRVGLHGFPVHAPDGIAPLHVFTHVFRSEPALELLDAGDRVVHGAFRGHGLGVLERQAIEGGRAVQGGQVAIAAFRGHEMGHVAEFGAKVADIVARISIVSVLAEAAFVFRDGRQDRGGHDAGGRGRCPALLVVASSLSASLLKHGGGGGDRYLQECSEMDSPGLKEETSTIAVHGG